MAESLAAASNVPMESAEVAAFRKEILTRAFHDIDIPKLASSLVRSSASSQAANGNGCNAMDTTGLVH